MTKKQTEDLFSADLFGNDEENIEIQNESEVTEAVEKDLPMDAPSTQEVNIVDESADPLKRKVNLKSFRLKPVLFCQATMESN